MNIELTEKYRHIIQNIIDANVKFYGFANKIEWKFFADPSIAIIAKTDPDLTLLLNINSVDYAYTINEPLHIEYFILHEIRHIYQRRLVFLYKTDRANCPAPELASRYDYEFNNYVNPTDRNGYYSQQIEFEAFIFSYSVILYKYGPIEYIKLPNYYEKMDAQRHIDCWIDIFRKQKL